MRKKTKTRNRLGRLGLMLVLASVCLWLLPRAWTSPLINIFQLWLPFQDGIKTAMDFVSNGISIEDPAVPAEAYRELELQKIAYEHQTAVLATRVHDLEHEVQQLTVTRFWQADSPALGPLGRLIPARVLSGDLLSWRDSRLVTAGTFKGVNRGALVMSAHYSIDRGQIEGLQPGLAIVLAETLIGWVDQVGTHASRIRLVSDVGVEMKVRVGRFSPDGFHPQARYYWMTGKGRGLLTINDVDRRDAEAGVLNIGDYVLSDPESTALPASLVIGTIRRIDLDRDHPLLAIAQVLPTLEPVQLEKVYIFDPAPLDE